MTSKAKITDTGFWTSIASSIDDPDYVNIFSNMAKGLFPQGCKYDEEKQRFVYTSGKKTVNIPLPSNDVDAARDVLLSFFKKCGMRSTQERQNQSDKLAKRHNNGGWRSVKNFRLQQEYLNTYVDKIRKLRSLTDGQDRQVRRLLFRALYCDYLDNTIVKYSHGGISMINGLEWNSKTRKHNLSVFPI